MDISFRTETIRKRNLDLIGKNLTILKRLFMVKQERGKRPPYPWSSTPVCGMDSLGKSVCIRAS